MVVQCFFCVKLKIKQVIDKYVYVKYKNKQKIYLNYAQQSE